MWKSACYGIAVAGVFLVCFGSNEKQICGSSWHGVGIEGGGIFLQQGSFYFRKSLRFCREASQLLLETIYFSYSEQVDFGHVLIVCKRVDIIWSTTES